MGENDLGYSDALKYVKRMPNATFIPYLTSTTSRLDTGLTQFCLTSLNSRQRWVRCDEKLPDIYVADPSTTAPCYEPLGRARWAA